MVGYLTQTSHFDALACVPLPDHNENTTYLPGLEKALRGFDVVVIDDRFAIRIREADEFYASVIPAELSPAAGAVMRQAFAGLLWSKQFYHFVIEDWLNGDPGQPPPPESRKHGRDCQWVHLFNEDVISMPDSWEYPWYAAWDLAFHMIPFAMVDPDFAKDQLRLFLREYEIGELVAYRGCDDGEDCVFERLAQVQPGINASLEIALTPEF